MDGDGIEMCKGCSFYIVSKGVCSLRHIKVSSKTAACSLYSDVNTVPVRTETCATCKHHFLPNKDYPNIHYYYDYKGDFFLCKCKFHKEAKFLNKDYCKKYEKESLHKHFKGME